MSQLTRSHRLLGGGPGLTRLRGARAYLIAVCPALLALTSAPQAFILSFPLKAGRKGTVEPEPKEAFRTLTSVVDGVQVTMELAHYPIRITTHKGKVLELR